MKDRRAPEGMRHDLDKAVKAWAAMTQAGRDEMKMTPTQRHYIEELVRDYQKESVC